MARAIARGGLRRDARRRRPVAGLVVASGLTPQAHHQVGSVCSSSNVTATSELADSRTLSALDFGDKR